MDCVAKSRKGDLQGPPGDVMPLWTVKEVAAFLRKSVRWVRYALRKPENEPGSIPHTKVGRTPRFDPAALKAWVEYGCPPAATLKTWQRKK